jgi:thymidylate kinase
MAAADPHRWVVIDGTGTVEDVARAVERAVAAVLPD